MSRWFRFYDEALDDPKVQMLPPDLFKAQFLAAVDGEENCFSAYLKEGRDRPSGPVWAALRAKVFARDGFKCTYCGKGGRLECDHVLPVTRGGGNEIENLTTACFGCNRSKRDKTVQEWRQ